jgi:hypothetical protein
MNSEIKMLSLKDKILEKAEVVEPAKKIKKVIKKKYGKEKSKKK